MNFLIPCHPICFYLILSNQLELLLTQALSLNSIFPKYIFQDLVSGNLAATISDHLPQFLIASHVFSNAPNTKTSIFELDWSKFNHEKFILDYFSVDWPHTLKLQNNDIDASFQNFFLTP